MAPIDLRKNLLMKTLLTFSLLLFTLQLFAQNLTLSGQVISEEGISLPGATVLLKDTNLGSITDNQGNYKISGIPAGQYELMIQYIGFEPYSLPIALERSTIKNISLTPGIALDGVIVIGRSLQGISRAINQQKNNVNITNVVSADQLGRFPDANIGDALKRVPGITMQNDQGEARNIIIRGIAPYYNSVTLNGDRIPSAEGDNRNIQMDLIPTDMVQLVQVNKTLTPDMDGDAIGGSVNLVTRKASSKPRLSAGFAPGYSPIRDKMNWTGNLIAGKRFFDDKFGIIYTGSYNYKDYGSDNFEVEYDYDDDPNDFYMSEFQIRKYDVIRQRFANGIDADYQINANHDISFNMVLTERKDWENRYRLTYKDLERDGSIGEIRRETKGGIDHNKYRRLEDQTMNKFGLSGDHIFGKLAVDWGLSLADAAEKRPNERYIVYRKKDVSGTISGLDTDRPFITSTNTLDPDEFKLKEMTEEFQDTHEENFKGKINFELPLNTSTNRSSLKFGYTYKDKTKKRNNTFNEYDIESDYDLMSTTQLVNEKFNHNNLGNKYQPGFYTSKQNLGDINVANYTAQPIYEEYIPGNYQADESVNAGYLQYEQIFGDRWTILAGGRFEATKINYNGFRLDLDNEEYSATNGKSDYSNFLPNVQIKYNPIESIVFHAAWSNSIARPNYYDLVPYQLLSFEDSEIAEGNPNLKAAESMNFDLMTEYYSKDLGLFSAGLFLKQIDHFFYTFNEENVVINGTTFDDYSQVRNGQKANVYGFETSVQHALDFISPFFNNFNIYANYTYTKSEASIENQEDSQLPLAGAAPNLFNFSLGYDNNHFNARLSYNFTSDYIDEYGDDAFENIYYDKQAFLDINASYILKSGWTIFGEAKNVTNQPLRYYQGDGGQKSRPFQTEYYQPNYNLGVKFDL